MQGFKNKPRDKANDCYGPVTPFLFWPGSFKNKPSKADRKEKPDNIDKKRCHSALLGWFVRRVVVIISSMNAILRAPCVSRLPFARGELFPHSIAFPGIRLG